MSSTRRLTTDELLDALRQPHILAQPGKLTVLLGDNRSAIDARLLNEKVAAMLQLAIALQKDAGHD